jgi:hypothetical protein
LGGEEGEVRLRVEVPLLRHHPRWYGWLDYWPAPTAR